MKETSYDIAMARKYPEAVAVAVSVDRERERPNIITLGWHMCTSHQPPMVAISVGNARHSHQTITDCGEFVLAFPNADQLRAVLYCGTHSGRDGDKLKDSAFEAVSGTTVTPPLIKDACANFECRVVSSLETGDHTIFVGEVLASHVSETDTQRLYSMSDGSMQGLPA